MPLPVRSGNPGLNEKTFSGLPRPMAAGERMTVSVIDRQDSAQDYSYSVPGVSNSYTTGSARCSGFSSPKGT